ncbi:MAG: MBL fold metallo-hydrolase [Oscillospiraceae bacterium]|nr:MBL fold metallo-hydrolase [Oscillospiraceae bacterium]
MAEAITKNITQVWWKAGNVPWELQHRPFRVAPHIYYVGNTWVGAYLLDGGDELGLIDTTVFEDVYQVIEGIWELGFDPRSIRHILLSHCHIDHAGGVNQIKSISGGKVWQSKEDTGFMTHEANLELGDDFKIVPFAVDEFYADDKPIRIGNLTVHTRLTPGHTPGTTTFFIEDRDEDGRALTVAMHGGVGPNTMTDEYFEKFGLDKGLRRQFIEGCEALKDVPVDITIPSHPAHGDLMKRISDDPMDYTPLIDPKEWARFLEIRKGFAEKLEK